MKSCEPLCRRIKGNKVARHSHQTCGDDLSEGFQGRTGGGLGGRGALKLELVMVSCFEMLHVLFKGGEWVGWLKSWPVTAQSVGWMDAKYARAREDEG